MSEESAFLAAIRAAPADDAPRLVYADWLEERGRHDQAEFIRVEYAYRRAKARLEELAMTVDRKWAAQVSPANGLLLRGYPSDRKIMVIKVIREFLGCGLLEAKTLSEQLPAVLGGTFGKPALDGFRDQLREAGADVELHYIPSALGPASVQSPTPSAGR